jgi:hypothetical protein
MSTFTHARIRFRTGIACLAADQAHFVDVQTDRVTARMLVHNVQLGVICTVHLSFERTSEGGVQHEASAYCAPLIDYKTDASLVLLLV